MATATIYPSAPPPYNIRRNEFLNENYKVPINDGSDMGSEQPFYSPSLNGVLAPNFPYHLPFQQANNLSYFQRPQMGPAQNFPTNGVMYNGGMAPTFQPFTGLPHYQAPSFTAAPSLPSSSSTPLQNGLAPFPVPCRKGLRKTNPKSKSSGKHTTRNAAQSAKREVLIGKPSRKRGPNTRPPGTTFSNLLDILSDEVKEALNQDYEGCCETINTKDVSTKQKHMFSLRHCKNLSKEFQDQIPNFVCPAFIAFKTNCRSKAGRYDSTDRHCKNCVGFSEINKGDKGANPVVITRAQYDAIQTCRMTRAECEGQKQATAQFVEEANELARTTLANLFKDGFPDWLPVLFRKRVSNDHAAIMDPTPTLPTNNTTVQYVPVSNHPEQPSFFEPSLFDPARADECAEAFKNGFPVTASQGTGSNISDPFTDPSTQSSTLSMPDPVANHSEQPSVYLYEPSLFDPEKADERAEAFKNGPGFAVTYQEEGQSQSTALSLPASQAKYPELPSFYEPSEFNPEKVDWGYFSNLMQN